MNLRTRGYELNGPVPMWDQKVLIDPLLPIPADACLVDREIQHTLELYLPDQEKGVLSYEEYKSVEIVRFIEWQESKPGTSISIKPIDKCLARFLGLAKTKSDDKILGFVKEYGPLGIWPSILVKSGHRMRYSEPLYIYRTISRLLGSLLYLAEDLYNDKSITKEQWIPVVGEKQLKIWCDNVDKGSDSSWLTSQHKQYKSLLTVINTIAHHLWVSPILVWEVDDSLPYLSFDLNCDASAWDWHRLTQFHRNSSEPENIKDGLYESWDPDQEFCFVGLAATGKSGSKSR